MPVLFAASLTKIGLSLYGSTTLLDPTPTSAYKFNFSRVSAPEVDSRPPPLTLEGKRFYFSSDGRHGKDGERLLLVRPDIQNSDQCWDVVRDNVYYCAGENLEEYGGPDGPDYWSSLVFVRDGDKAKGRAVFLRLKDGFGDSVMCTHLAIVRRPTEEGDFGDEYAEPLLKMLWQVIEENRHDYVTVPKECYPDNGNFVALYLHLKKNGIERDDQVKGTKAQIDINVGIQV